MFSKLFDDRSAILQRCLAGAEAVCKKYDITIHHNLTMPIQAVPRGTEQGTSPSRTGASSRTLRASPGSAPFSSSMQACLSVGHPTAKPASSTRPTRSQKSTRPKHFMSSGTGSFTNPQLKALQATSPLQSQSQPWRLAYRTSMTHQQETWGHIVSQWVLVIANQFKA